MARLVFLESLLAVAACVALYQAAAVPLALLLFLTLCGLALTSLFALPSPTVIKCCVLSVIFLGTASVIEICRYGICRLETDNEDACWRFSPRLNVFIETTRRDANYSAPKPGAEGINYAQRIPSERVSEYDLNINTASKLLFKSAHTKWTLRKNRERTPVKLMAYGEMNIGLESNKTMSRNISLTQRFLRALYTPAVKSGNKIHVDKSTMEISNNDQRPDFNEKYKSKSPAIFEDPVIQLETIRSFENNKVRDQSDILSENKEKNQLVIHQPVKRSALKEKLEKGDRKSFPERMDENDQKEKCRTERNTKLQNLGAPAPEEVAQLNEKINLGRTMNYKDLYEKTASKLLELRMHLGRKRSRMPLTSEDRRHAQSVERHYPDTGSLEPFDANQRQKFPKIYRQVDVSSPPETYREANSGEERTNYRTRTEQQDLSPQHPRKWRTLQSVEMKELPDEKNDRWNLYEDPYDKRHFQNIYISDIPGKHLKEPLIPVQVPAMTGRGRGEFDARTSLNHREGGELYVMAGHPQIYAPRLPLSYAYLMRQQRDKPRTWKQFECRVVWPRVFKIEGNQWTLYARREMKMKEPEMIGNQGILLRAPPDFDGQGETLQQSSRLGNHEELNHKSHSTNLQVTSKERENVMERKNGDISDFSRKEMPHIEGTGSIEVQNETQAHRPEETPLLRDSPFKLQEESTKLKSLDGTEVQVISPRSAEDISSVLKNNSFPNAEQDQFAMHKQTSRQEDNIIFGKKSKNETLQTRGNKNEEKTQIESSQTELLTNWDNETDELMAQRKGSTKHDTQNFREKEENSHNIENARKKLPAQGSPNNDDTLMGVVSNRLRKTEKEISSFDAMKRTKIAKNLHTNEYMKKDLEKEEAEAPFDQPDPKTNDKRSNNVSEVPDSNASKESQTDREAKQAGYVSNTKTRRGQKGVKKYKGEQAIQKAAEEDSGISLSPNGTRPVRPKKLQNDSTKNNSSRPQIIKKRRKKSGKRISAKNSLGKEKDISADDAKENATPSPDSLKENETSTPNMVASREEENNMGDAETFHTKRAAKTYRNIYGRQMSSDSPHSIGKFS